MDLTYELLASIRTVQDIVDKSSHLLQLVANWICDRKLLSPHSIIITIEMREWALSNLLVVNIVVYEYSDSIFPNTLHNTYIHRKPCETPQFSPDFHCCYIILETIIDSHW